MSEPSGQGGQGGTWQQVVTEADPSTMKPSDVANLGPAPRDLTVPLNKYVKHMKPSWTPLFVFLAFFQVVGVVAVIATGKASGTVVTAGLWAVGIVALASWSAKRTKARRDALRAVLRDGQLRFARVTENRQVQMGRRRVYKYYAAFDIDGRRVPYVTYNDGMSMVNRGSLVEVVYSPQYPDEIVPTFLLV